MPKQRHRRDQIKEKNQEEKEKKTDDRKGSEKGLAADRRSITVDTTQEQPNCQLPDTLNKRKTQTTAVTAFSSSANVFLRNQDSRKNQDDSKVCRHNLHHRPSLVICLRLQTCEKRVHPKVLSNIHTRGPKILKKTENRA